MHNQKPSVFIIEDDVAVRTGFQLQIEDLGFYVRGAESIEDGRNILREEGDKFDVFLVDMRLDNYSDFYKIGGVTGPDLVIDFYKEKSKEKYFQKPEPIIFSAFSEIEFYQKALSIGAATYLLKPTPSEIVIRHLRALAVKRILSNSVELVDKIEEIVLKSRSEAQLYENFCRDILGQVFSKCLGSDFTLILTRFDNLFLSIVKNYDSEATDLAAEDEIYKGILPLMYINSNTAAPFLLDENKLNVLREQGINISEEQFAKFKDAAFISMPLSANFRISIGILKDDSLEYSEPPIEMAKLLINYVNPAATMFLGEITTARWDRIVSERNMTIRKLSAFCDNVGGEQLYILEDAALRNKDRDEYLDNEAYYKLKALAEDLHQTGRLLEPISERSFSSDNLPVLSMKELLSSAWQDLKDETKISRNINFDDIKFSIDGDCEVRGEKEELFLIAFRLLHWFALRKPETPKDNDYSINIICLETEKESVITFEDNSYRLPEELRNNLFSAFSPATPPPTSSETSNITVDEKYGPGLYLALYLSQIIVEEKYSGSLRECSKELDGETGHKIELRIPLSK